MVKDEGGASLFRGLAPNTVSLGKAQSSRSHPYSVASVSRGICVRSLVSPSLPPAPTSRTFTSLASDSACFPPWPVTAPESLPSFAHAVLQIRAILMNSSQLVSYDFFKDLLLTHNLLSDGMPLHLVSSAAAGTVATTICAPADVVKSRVMNAKPGGQGPVALLAENFKKEGPRFLFRGWLPAWSELCCCRQTVRVVPEPVIVLTLFSPPHAEHYLHVRLPRATEKDHRHGSRKAMSSNRTGNHIRRYLFVS
jgi:hypothetical protein